MADNNDGWTVVGSNSRNRGKNGGRLVQVNTLEYLDSSNLNHQDWSTTKFNNYGKNSDTNTRTKGVPNSGAVVRKNNINRQTGPQNAQKAHKIERCADEGNFEINTVSHDLKIKIQQARQHKKWTQKDLANQCNLPTNIIQEYESGKAIPNPQHLVAMSRVLGVKLSNKKK